MIEEEKFLEIINSVIHNNPNISTSIELIKAIRRHINFKMNVKGALGAYISERTNSIDEYIIDQTKLYNELKEIVGGNHED